MNKYNPDIHHRRSIRLKGYDYAQAGLYFITICTHNRECIFGEIINGEMGLNELGEIAFNEWKKTPEIRPNVELGEYVIMPNHMHGIIRLLDRGELHSSNDIHELHSSNDIHELHSSNDSDNIKGEFNSPLRSPSQTIGAIVRGYKSSVTKQINLLNLTGEFNSPQRIWQRNYHEHIIRDEKSYNNISNYILNNPLNWTEDKFYG
jgi:REP element-mobilizing transposase RayT